VDTRATRRGWLSEFSAGLVEVSERQTLGCSQGARRSGRIKNRL